MAEKVLDVAMESTSQEILENVEKINNIVSIKKQYVYTNTTTSSTTPINITGKGRLYWFDINARVKSTLYPTVRIIIDGNVILNAQLYYNSSNETAMYCSATNSNFIISNGSSGSYLSFKGCSQFVYCAIDANELTADSRISVKSSGSVQSSNELNYYINDYIEFENSLKIEITNCVTTRATECYICYSLL